MSVKLIIVALLAAATTTQAMKTATIKTCASATDCTCDSTPENTKKYTVNKCEKKDSKYWKADSCATGEDVIVKGYGTNANCEPGTLAVSTECKAIAYHQAKCNGDTVTLTVGCSGEACNSDCASPVEFSLSGNKECTKVGSKFYKLTGDDCNENRVSFSEFSESDCSGTAVMHEVPTSCGASHYRKGTCTSEKTSFKTCTSSDCSTTCTEEVDVKLNTPKLFETKYLFIESCNADQALTYKVYDAWLKYKTECSQTESGSAIAKCGDQKVATATKTLIPGKKASMTVAPPADGGNNNSNDNGNDSGNDSGSGSGSDNTTAPNTTNNDSGIPSSAPAHSIGVMTFVLCLMLAYTY